MECDAKLVAPYMELGRAAKDSNWQESGKYLDRAVELDPVIFRKPGMPTSPTSTSPNMMPRELLAPR